MSKVIFIGDVAFDEYYELDKFPKLKDKVLVKSLGKKMGGMIANAACIYNNLAKKDVSFFTALNSSYDSKALVKELNDQGLDTSMMVYDDNLPDAKTLIFLSENEHTVFIPTLGIKSIEIPKKTYENLKTATAIYSTFCEIKPLRYKNMDIYEILNSLDNTLFFCDLDVADINKEDWQLLQMVDILFVNENGYNNLVKLFKEDFKEKLFEKRLKILIQTKAEKGSTLFTKDKIINKKAFKTPIVDVTGAGDTFCSSFMYYYLKGKSLEESLEFANAAGSLAVMHMGARNKDINEESILDKIKENL